MKSLKLSLNRETLRQLNAEQTTEIVAGRRKGDTSIGIVCTYYCPTMGGQYTCNGSVGIACTAVAC